MLGLHESTFGDHGGQHGQESEESKEGKKDSEEEKEVTVRRKLRRIRILRQGLCALRSTDRRRLPPSKFPNNRRSGRTLMQMAAAKRSGFLLGLDAVIEAEARHLAARSGVKKRNLRH